MNYDASTNHLMATRIMDMMYVNMLRNWHIADNRSMATMVDWYQTASDASYAQIPAVKTKPANPVFARKASLFSENGPEMWSAPRATASNIRTFNTSYSAQKQQFKSSVKVITAATPDTQAQFVSNGNRAAPTKEENVVNLLYYRRNQPKPRWRGPA